MAPPPPVTIAVRDAPCSSLGRHGLERAGLVGLPRQLLAQRLGRARPTPRSRASRSTPVSMPSRAAGRRGPRSRCCRSRPARTGSRRSRRQTRRAARARLDRGDRVRVAGVARVVEVAPTAAPSASRAGHEPRPGAAPPTPIVSARTISSAPAAPRARASRAPAPGRPRPSNGQPKATRERDGDRQAVLARALDEPGGALDAPSTVVPWLRCANVVGHRERVRAARRRRAASARS